MWLGNSGNIIPRGEQQSYSFFVMLFIFIRIKYENSYTMCKNESMISGFVLYTNLL